MIRYVLIESSTTRNRRNPRACSTNRFRLESGSLFPPPVPCSLLARFRVIIGRKPFRGIQERNLIARYTRAEMGRIWSEENRFQKWLAVELAATETLAEAGIVPLEAARKLREKASIDVARINKIEADVKHDVIAFTIAVQESVGDKEAARALAALRHDLKRRCRYGAGPAGARVFRFDRQGD